MDVSIPESLTGFITRRVRSGGYADADAFIADLLQSEAGIMEGVSNGEPLALDRHFDRRLAALLDDGVASGDYIAATPQEFDEMEREAASSLEQKRRDS